MPTFTQTFHLRHSYKNLRLKINSVYHSRVLTRSFLAKLETSSSNLPPFSRHTKKPKCISSTKRALQCLRITLILTPSTYYMKFDIKKGTFQPEINQLKISNYFPFLSSSGKLHTLGIFLPHLIESRLSGLTSW